MSGMFTGLFGGGGEAKRVAGVVAAGQNAAADIVAKQYQATKANYQPYLDAGTSAMGSYQNLAAGLPGQFNPILGQMGTTVNSMQPIIDKLTSSNLNDYQQSPGYDFRMQQGEKALENSAAARGTLFSGSTGKALTQYGQDYGTNDYQNYLSNLQGQLGAVNTQLGAQGNYLTGTMNAANAEMNPYGVLMNQGANMTGQLGQLGYNSANSQAGYITGAADATAQGMVAKSNEEQAAGQHWISMAAQAVGAYFGGAMGAQAAGKMAEGANGTPLATPNMPSQGSGGIMNGMTQNQQYQGQPMQAYSGNGSSGQSQGSGYAATDSTGGGYQPFLQTQQMQSQPYQAQGMGNVQSPTAAYQGTNYYNPTQGGAQGIDWGF